LPDQRPTPFVTSSCRRTLLRSGLWSAVWPVDTPTSTSKPGLPPLSPKKAGPVAQSVGKHRRVAAVNSMPARYHGRRDVPSPCQIRQRLTGMPPDLSRLSTISALISSGGGRAGHPSRSRRKSAFLIGRHSARPRASPVQARLFVTLPTSAPTSQAPRRQRLHRLRHQIRAPRIRLLGSRHEPQPNSPTT
jgi:hypothetical protein